MGKYWYLDLQRNDLAEYSAEEYVVELAYYTETRFATHTLLDVTRKIKELHKKHKAFFSSSNSRKLDAWIFTEGRIVFGDRAEQTWLGKSIDSLEYITSNTGRIDFLDKRGRWEAVNAIIQAVKTRNKKQGRKPELCEVITTQSTEVVYTFLIPLNAFDKEEFTNRAFAQVDVLEKIQILLQSPVVYLENKRLSLATREMEIDSTKRSPYIKIEGIVIQEELDRKD